MPSPGRFAGKVALVTGAARGQGRSHAVRLAEEGADVILLDICADYEVTEYPGATLADLQDTAHQIEMLDRRAVATQVDVRDLDALQTAVDFAVADLGRLDVVVVNAGICVLTAWDEVTPQIWRDTLDTNLTGAWHTLVTTAPHLIAAGGGSVVCTGSTCGIARTMANELAQYSVRVNVVHPTGVLTDLTDGLSRIGELIERNPTLGQTFQNALPVTRIESADVTNAVLYLASDEARYVTGTELLVDAGNTNF
jgi:NAD(P)-dependent dehydrogenase (short-subunit alcohol dehydrogenase family)